MVLNRILAQAESIFDGARFKFENIYVSTVSTVEDVVDFTSATFFKACGSVIGTYYALKYAGLTIALVTAPVPTLIAMAVLWMMELSVDSLKTDIDSELKDRAKKRDFDRVVKILKKYGKIPKTAVVETEHMRMEIDSITGSVTGEIRTGFFNTATQLSDVDDENLIAFAATRDEETKSLVEAYLSYKTKLASATVR